MNRHMHLGVMFVSRGIACQVAALMEAMFAAVEVRVMQRDVKADHFLSGTFDLLVERKVGTKPFPKYEVELFTATANAAKHMALVKSDPATATAVLGFGFGSDWDKGSAIQRALLASGARDVVVLPAGTNFSGRRMFLATGTVPGETTVAYARHVLAEASHRVLMTTETVSVREAFDPDACGGLTVVTNGAVKFTNVVFY